MNLQEIEIIAERVKELLAPHCIRIQIAGSIRRKKEDCNDIEIVAIPKPYETGLFEDGIASVVNQWKKVKGDLPCKYTQRILPEGIKLDLFFAEPNNWGYILAIRTGSASYSKNVLAATWVKRGYHGHEGNLYARKDSGPLAIPEEIELFKILDIPYMDPEARTDEFADKYYEMLKKRK